MDAIGDEEHLVMHCTKTIQSNFRKQYFNTIASITPQLTALSKPAQFRYLISCKDSDITPVFAELTHRLLKGFADG